MRIVASPALYAAWFVVVVLALVAAYFVDPYVFGFTALGLAGASAAVGVLGCAVCTFAGSLDRRAKLAILCWLASSGIAVVGALALLRTFKWA